MSSGMNTEQAKEYAKTMTYSEAVSNLKYAKGIRYRKATRIKLRELAKIADRLDEADTPQTDSEIPKNALRSACTGCRFVGMPDTKFPCANCLRKNKDYYDSEYTEGSK